MKTKMRLWRLWVTAAVVVSVWGACAASLAASAAPGLRGGAVDTTPPQSSSTETLKKLHTAAAPQNRDRGYWPPIEGLSGLMFPIRGMYPDYVTDPRLLVNPANTKASEKVQNLPVNEKTLPAFWNNGSYWYLGYAVTNEREGMAFVNALKKMLEEGRAPSGDIRVAKGSGNGGGDTIYRLREGVARFFVQDINNPAATAVSEDQIPVMISVPNGNGGEVLFMDGHVEFMHYPGKFPMTPAFVAALKSLEQMMRTAHRPPP